MASPTSSPSSPEKKSWRQAVLTATPVALTVVATGLAGLSSSEMTLAQYHRSLAAQNQSKASDQWGFFQAKRMRQTSMEVAYDQLPPRNKSTDWEPNQLEALSHRLTRALQEANKHIDTLEQKNPKAAARLKETVQASARRAEAIDNQLHETLLDKNIHLSAHQLPEVEDVTWQQPEIDRVVQAISNRVPEHELDPMLRQVKEADLQRAIETAEENARRFEAICVPVTKALDQIGALAHEQLSGAANFHQALRDFRDALDEAGMKDHAWDIPSAVGPLEKLNATVQTAAEELDNLMKATRYAFTARRQKRESDYHLKTAGLYEVQVRADSLVADRHRTRSKMFFFGMLAAQAGVTIASLALAVRQRNILWALAGLAGIAAILFSGYVYLYM
jgi:Domain of unknown function (DUF4337)